MKNVYGKNSFRKVLSVENNNMHAENFSRFRKSITDRISTSLTERMPERIPGHDIMYFE